MTLAVRTLSALPRGRQRRLRGEESGTVAEEIVADELGPTVDHRPDEAEWYDLVRSTTSAKTEVKSAWRQVGESYPADGRFRLRRDQTRSLRAASAAGVAWYAFVLFDADGDELRIRRARPSTVSQWVRERGGWNRAGHAEFEYQYKLPIDVVFPGVAE